jgi:hypothetical protein
MQTPPIVPAAMAVAATGGVRATTGSSNSGTSTRPLDADVLTVLEVGACVCAVFVCDTNTCV